MTGYAWTNSIWDMLVLATAGLMKPNTSIVEYFWFFSDNLRELFTHLHFDVDLRKNLSAVDMKVCLESYQHRDHSSHDAFVCCITSHGMHGSVCAADGNQVTIMSLMELFYDDACPSLQGKPKLFFIGACQTEGNLFSNDHGNWKWLPTWQLTGTCRLSGRLTGRY